MCEEILNQVFFTITGEDIVTVLKCKYPDMEITDDLIREIGENYGQDWWQSLILDIDDVLERRRIEDVRRQKCF